MSELRPAPSPLMTPPAEGETAPSHPTTVDPTVPAVREAEFVALVSAVRPSLVRYAGSLAPPNDSEDITQEALIRAWCGLDGFKGQQEAMQGWLFKITRNAAHNWRRGIDRRPPLTDNNESELDGTEHSPYSDLVTDIMRRDAIRILGQFPDNSPYREALIMGIDGASMEEIAQHLGVSRNAAKVKVHRARKAAEKMLAEHSSGTALADIL